MKEPQLASRKVSPTPWRLSLEGDRLSIVDASGKFVVTFEDADIDLPNAAAIVNRVNSFDTLMELVAKQ